jgi:hypothetical protein
MKKGALAVRLGTAESAEGRWQCDRETNVAMLFLKGGFQHCREPVDGPAAPPYWQTLLLTNSEVRRLILAFRRLFRMLVSEREHDGIEIGDGWIGPKADLKECRANYSK